MKTGLKLCDIMYPPCGMAEWGATKCNQNTVVNMSDADRQALINEATHTGEKRFYERLLNESESKLNTPEVKKLTDQYRSQRTKALKHCQSPGVLNTVTNYIKTHPYVKQDSRGEKLLHFQTEKSNPLDPLTVCLGQFCHEKMNTRPAPPIHVPRPPKH